MAEKGLAAERNVCPGILAPVPFGFFQGKEEAPVASLWPRLASARFSMPNMERRGAADFSPVLGHVTCQYACFFSF